MKAKTLVIIPAYNEARSIAGVVSGLNKRYPDIDVLVIDDGSQDGTAGLAQVSGAKVLSHSFNMGYGVSLQTGYKYAIREGFQYVVQMDGDGQHDPSDVISLLENIKDSSCDIVFGSRFLGPNNYKASFYRMTGIRFFRLVLRLLSGQDISDPTTGFQAMNRRVLELFAQDVFPYDYPDADVIMLLSKLRFKMKEVPVSMNPKSGGKSMHGDPLNVIYYVFKMLLSMLMTKFRRHEIKEKAKEADICR